MIIIVSTLNFKDIIDLPKWRPLAICPSTNPTVMASDYRNNEDRHPYIFFFGGFFFAYNTKNDEWIRLTDNALATTSTSTFFMSAQGPRGYTPPAYQGGIGPGATTTSIPLSTALPATVGVNQLANRGDGRGFKIRIMGNAGGSSGKTEEHLVIANTGGTTPTILLDSALSFTPVSGDTYEFLSGRVFILGNANSAGSWKYYDILTNSFSGVLSVANLPASWSDSNLVGLDELLVPYDQTPGLGFFGNLTATATAAASITGQATGGDASVVINQYRNFQIRIVQDTGTPTSVGQRRNITSHTAGPSPVYTVPAWTVQPSATAIYVIENNGDRIIAWMNGTTQTSTYTISTNAWDANTTFAVRPVAPSTGLISHQAFSIEPDTASPPNARQSFIFAFRGATGTLDLFDISGAATGTWTSIITYGNSSGNTGFSIGGSSTQDPATMQGRYIYINQGTGAAPTQRFYRFDMKNRVLEPQTFLEVPVNTAVLSVPLKYSGYTVFIDGNTKLSYILFSPQNAAGTTQLMFALSINR